MSQLELDQDPAGEQTKRAEKDDQDDTGYEAYHCERRRQREHAIADDLCYHKDCNELPR